MDTTKNTLLKLFQTFSESFRLDVFGEKTLGLYCSAGKTLLTIDNNRFEFIDNEVIKFMNLHKSRLSDAFLDFGDIKNLCKAISQKSKGIGFNHLGFCYQVESKNKEINRVLKVTKNKQLHLYEVPSNDFALWLFVGDISNPQDPIIEFLPVEKINDYFRDYWIPHVHFAFNTDLSVDEIKYTTHEALKGNRSANPAVVVYNVIYQLRIWLGTISGINYHLDLLTNKPGNSLLDTRKLLKEVSG